MPYLIAAYVVIWLVIFVFVLTMNRRLSALDDELTALEEALKRRETP
ncbi:MAG: CcmD family protein [Anaerolineae bacterium]|nr:CcmD family protein [Caldilineales bacterium]MCX7851667.1 CcmD family protein [Caldilineales bacterium]MDW8270518.1 CcmD family protein [Anaerolineae bacterium]